MVDIGYQITLAGIRHTRNDDLRSQDCEPFEQVDHKNNINTKMEQLRALEALDDLKLNEIALQTVESLMQARRLKAMDDSFSYYAAVCQNDLVKQSSNLSSKLSSLPGSSVNSSVCNSPGNGKERATSFHIMNDMKKDSAHSSIHLQHPRHDSSKSCSSVSSAETLMGEDKSAAVPTTGDTTTVYQPAVQPAKGTMNPLIVPATPAKRASETATELVPPSASKANAPATTTKPGVRLAPTMTRDLKSRLGNTSRYGSAKDIDPASFQAESLDNELNDLSVLLSATSEEWQPRVNALNRLKVLVSMPCVTKCENFANFIHELTKPLVLQMSDLRSIVVKTACDCIKSIAEQHKAVFARFAVQYMRACFALVIKTIKVIATAGDELAKTLVATTSMEAIMGIITDTLSNSQHPILREHCATYLFLLLDRMSKQTRTYPSLHHEEDMTCLTKGVYSALEDSSAAVRNIGIACYAKLSLVAPDRAAKVFLMVDSGIQRRLKTPEGKYTASIDKELLQTGDSVMKASLINSTKRNYSAAKSSRPNSNTSDTLKENNQVNTVEGSTERSTLEI